LNSKDYYLERLNTLRSDTDQRKKPTPNVIAKIVAEPNPKVAHEAPVLPHTNGNGHSNGNGNGNGHGNGHAADLAATTVIVSGGNGSGGNRGWGGGPRRPQKSSGGSEKYIQMARRWWWASAAVLVVGLIASGAYMKWGPAPYTSTASVIVPVSGPQTGDSRGSSPDNTARAATNYTGQANAPYLLQLASNDLQQRFNISQRQLQEMQANQQITIGQVRNSNMINFTVIDNNPALAKALTDALANTFINDVNSKNDEDLKTRRETLGEQIETARQRLASAAVTKRQEDLSSTLRTERQQYLQLQLQYQQELQRQVSDERATIGTSGDSPVPATQVARLEQLASEANSIRGQSEQSMREEQDAVAETVNNLKSQLASVRGESQNLAAELGPDAAQAATNSTADQTVREAKAREQELSRSLADQQARLLKLQTDYQTELQKQADARSRAATGTAAAAPTRPSAQAAANKDLTPESLQAQQDALQREIADLQRQHNEIQAQLGRLPKDIDIVNLNPQIGSSQPNNATYTASLQNQQETARDLRTRDGSVQSALQDRQTRLVQLQTQYQQLVDSEVFAASSAVGPTGPTPEQQALAAASAQAGAQLLDTLRTQLNSTQDSVADLTSQLAEARAITAALPTSSVDPAQTAVLTAQQKRLKDLQTQEAELGKSLETQQTRLFTIQRNLYQTSAANVDSSRTAALGSASVTAPRASTGGVAARSPEVTAAANEVRTRWYQVTGEIATDLDKNMQQTTQELDDIKAQIDAQPTKTDPALAGALTTAYNSQLQSLTASYVNLEISAQSNMKPVQLVGTGASDPIPAGGQKKTLMMGVAGSAMAAIAVAFALEQLRNRRLAKKKASAGARTMAVGA